MKRLRAGRGTSAAALGLAIAVAGGGAYALASGGGTITACVHKGDGTLYIAKCKKKDKKITWSKTGSQGPAGAAGPAGSPGPTGGTGAAGATGPSDVYEVELAADVTGIPAGTTKTLTLPDLPAGAYAVYGKATILPSQTNSGSSQCVLTAGSDSDQSYTPLRTDAVYVFENNTQLTHTFSSAGSVTMACVAFTNTWGLVDSTGNTRIIAIKLGTQHKTTGMAS
jgi:hypothetical protein